MQVNDVIGYADRGADAHIVFDLGDPMGASSCVGCGECVQACPTGSLLPARRITSYNVCYTKLLRIEAEFVFPFLAHAAMEP